MSFRTFGYGLHVSSPIVANISESSPVFFNSSLVLVGGKRYQKFIIPRLYIQKFSLPHYFLYIVSYPIISP